MKTLLFFSFFIFSLLSVKANSSNPCAFVTLITGSDVGFIDGAITLGASLKLHQAAGDLLLLHTHPFSSYNQQRLTKEGFWTLRLISENIEQPEGHAYKRRLKEGFNKLAIFRLTEYNVVVYLDADTLVLKDINELCVGVNAQVAAVSRGPNFNAGVMVLRPSEEFYQDVKLHLNNAEPNFPGTDQGILNSYFNGMFSCPYVEPLGFEDQHTYYGCARLPARYNGDVLNYLVNSNHWPYSNVLEDYETPKIIHYTFVDLKPWDWWTYLFIPNHWLWWNVFVETGTPQSHVILERVVSGLIIAGFTFIFFYFINKPLSGVLYKSYSMLKNNVGLMVFLFMIYQLFAFWLSYLISNIFFFSPETNYLVFSVWYIGFFNTILFSHLEHKSAAWYRFIWVSTFTAWSLIFLYAVGDEVSFWTRIAVMAILAIIFHLVLFLYLFVRYILMTIVLHHPLKQLTLASAAIDIDEEKHQA